MNLPVEDILSVVLRCSTPATMRWLKYCRKGAALTGPKKFRYTRKVEARYPSGKGEVCKTFMRGFDSHPRLHQIPNFYQRLKGPHVCVPTMYRQGRIASFLVLRISIELPDGGLDPLPEMSQYFSGEQTLTRGDGPARSRCAGRD